MKICFIETVITALGLSAISTEVVFETTIPGRPKKVIHIRIMI